MIDHFSSLINCINLHHLFLFFESKHNLWIIQAFSQGLPISLQVLSLEFYDQHSTIMFVKETEKIWKTLDNNLGSSKYPDLQVIQILLWIPQSSEKQNILSEDLNSVIIKDDNTRTKTDNGISDQLNTDIEHRKLDQQNELKDKLIQLNQSNIFQDNFPQCYKKGLLWLGSVDLRDRYIYPVFTSTRKSKIWKTRKRLEFEFV